MPPIVTVVVHRFQASVISMWGQFGHLDVHQGKSLVGPGLGVRATRLVRSLADWRSRSGSVRKGSRGDEMAAMKPRTGDGPLEVTKEGRGIVMRVPLEGGGRLVVEMSADEAGALGEALKGVVTPT